MTKDSSAKRKAGKRKPEKLSFTQDFIPIKNLEHGIIETTDGRYIKILEIEPINFMLRSEEEQYEIICSFASWLKISPVHLQFKSITRKADSDKHIAMLRKETETEESEQCKKLSEGYIRLIKDVGSREALTRRFFLIFRYEELRRNENSDYGQICSTLLTAEQNARAYFMQCGNNILQPKDPDEATAEILYMFFNRRSCVEEPFHSRVDRIVLDTMAAKNKVIGIDPVPHIRMAHFIAPRGIDLTHRNYIIMDGLYYSFLYIKGNGYPNKVRAGWMSSLINAGEGIDVDVFLRRENRSKTIDKVAQRIRLNRTKLKSMQDTSTDYEELAGSIQAGYFIKQGIANYNEDLFYMSVFVTVSARTYEELMWRKQQMTDMLKSMDMYVSDCSFQQEDALRTVMPFLQISLKLEKKSKRNVLTSGAASTYMFTSFEMSDDTGVLLGINRHNNSLCIVDLFDTKKNKNANLNLLGKAMKAKLTKGILLILSVLCILCVPVTPVYAVQQGTDGSELQVVKAEQLEIQLGTAWSGVEFQLKTDAGVYPGAVKVGTDGVLRLEIGGSSRYILTCMNSSTSIPEPEDTADSTDRTQAPATTEQNSESNEKVESAIPTLHIILFAGGMVIAIGTLIVMQVLKKKRENEAPDDEEDEE